MAQLYSHRRYRTLRRGTVALMLWFACLPGMAAAQNQDVIRIAAIVNDEIISAFDLDNRVRLVAATSNLPAQPEVLQRLRPQVLRTMIDERMQMQEAKRLSIRVSQREIRQTIENLERQNNMPRGELVGFLARNNVDPSALEMQLRAKISWLKLTGRTLARQISVGDAEVKEELERLRNLQGKPRMRVMEIFLAVDSPETEVQIRQTADRLVTQILNGARFDALAREFSQSAAAAKGGNLGWITDSELDENLASALAVMQPGQVSQPIRTLTGYHILLLADRRAPQSPDAKDQLIEYRQLSVPFPAGAPTAEVNAQRQLAQEVTDTVRSCENFVRKGRSIGARGMENIQNVALSAISGALRQTLETLEVNVPSHPLRAPDGFMVFIVCSRQQSLLGLPTADALKDRMRRERLDRMAQRYMRDLRRAAYVDLR